MRGRAKLIPAVVLPLACAPLACALMDAARAAEDCEAASGSQAELTDCYGRALKASDTELNALYKRIVAQLKENKPTLHLLVVAQKAWAGYRDAECTFATAGGEGGTIHGMIDAICLDQITRKRVGEFKAYLKCGEGDPGCAASIH